jgi:2-polyprenyl-3-methyl-5-hydroxy-6-metoxy-1,4-benzoquinol methylase
MTLRANEFASEQYWSSIWRRVELGHIGVWEADPAVKQQSKLISGLIEEMLQRKETVNILEIGCANSFWLPHFARRFNVNVYGLDYSLPGCFQAKNQLNRQHIDGHIFCQDFFNFVEDGVENFDIIISFGFIEHFGNPSLALGGMYQILRPGGIVFANVPNIAGIYGYLQKKIDWDVYNGHILMSDMEIAEYARQAGFIDVYSGYIGGLVYFSVLNFQTSKSSIAHAIISGLGRGVRLADIVIGRSLEYVRLNKSHSISSPYVYVVAKKGEIPMYKIAEEI